MMSCGSTNRKLWRISVVTSCVFLGMAWPLSGSTHALPSPQNIPDMNDFLGGNGDYSQSRHDKLDAGEDSQNNLWQRNRLLKALLGTMSKKKRHFQGGNKDEHTKKRMTQGLVPADLDRRLRLESIKRSHQRGDGDMNTLPYFNVDIPLNKKQGLSFFSGERKGQHFPQNNFESVPSKRQQGWYIQYGKRGTDSSQNAQTEVRNLVLQRLAKMHLDMLGDDSQPIDDSELILSDGHLQTSQLDEKDPNHGKYTKSMATTLSEAGAEVKNALTKLLESLNGASSGVQSSEALFRRLGPLGLSKESKDKLFSERREAAPETNPLWPQNVELYQNSMERKNTRSHSSPIPQDAFSEPAKRQQGWYTQYGKRGWGHLTIQGEGSVR